MAPKYFTDDVVGAMNKHRTLLRQRAARQVGRGLTAGAMGAQGRVEEAQEFLDNTSLGAINARRQERFGKRVSLMGESVDRGARRETDVRQNTLMRDLRDVDAEIAALRAQVTAGQVNATLRGDALQREFQFSLVQRAEANDLLMNGSPYTQGLLESSDAARGNQLGALAGVLSGNPNALPVYDSNGNALGYQGGEAANPFALTAESVRLYISDRGNDDGNRITIEGGRAGQPFDPNPQQPLEPQQRSQLLFGALLHTAQQYTGQAGPQLRQDLMNPDHPLGQAVREQFTREGITFPEDTRVLDGITPIATNIRDGAAMQEHIEAQAAIGRPSAFANLSQTARGAANVTERDLQGFVNMPPDQLDILVRNGSVSERERDAIETTRTAIEDTTRADIEQIIERGGDPGEVAHNINVILRGYPPEQAERIYDNAAANAVARNVGMGPAKPYDMILRDGGNYANQRQADADAATEAAARAAAGMGLDTSRLEASQQRLRENREQERRTYADEAAFTADPENAALLEAAQKGELDSAGQAELEERLARIEDEGTTLVMGIQVPNHMVPQPGDVQGEIELMTYLTMNYPNHPTVAQSRDAIMASPEFQAWREARGYTGKGTPDAYEWRQFTREYQVQKRMNLAAKRAQTRVNRRAGIIPEELDLPDMPSDDVALTRRAGRQYRRDVRGAATERLQSERQAQRPEREEREPSTPLFERLRAAGDRQRSEPVRGPKGTPRPGGSKKGS